MLQAKAKAVSDNNTKVLTDKDNGKIFKTEVEESLPQRKRKTNKKAVETEVEESKVDRKRKPNKKAESEQENVKEKIV